MALERIVELMLRGIESVEVQVAFADAAHSRSFRKWLSDYLGCAEKHNSKMEKKLLLNLQKNVASATFHMIQTGKPAEVSRKLHRIAEDYKNLMQNVESYYDVIDIAGTYQAPLDDLNERNKSVLHKLHCLIMESLIKAKAEQISYTTVLNEINPSLTYRVKGREYDFECPPNQLMGPLMMKVRAEAGLPLFRTAHPLEGVIVMKYAGLPYAFNLEAKSVRKYDYVTLTRLAEVPQKEAS